MQPTAAAANYLIHMSSAPYHYPLESGAACRPRATTGVCALRTGMQPPVAPYGATLDRVPTLIIFHRQTTVTGHASHEDRTLYSKVLSGVSGSAERWQLDSVDAQFRTTLYCSGHAYETALEKTPLRALQYSAT